MVSLLIADELAETYAELKKAPAETEASSDAAMDPAAAQQLEDRLAEIVDAAAARIEAATAGLTAPVPAAE